MARQLAVCFLMLLAAGPLLAAAQRAKPKLSLAQVTLSANVISFITGGFNPSTTTPAPETTVAPNKFFGGTLGALNSLWIVTTGRPGLLPTWSPVATGSDSGGTVNGIDFTGAVAPCVNVTVKASATAGACACDQTTGGSSLVAVIFDGPTNIRPDPATPGSFLTDVCGPASLLVGTFNPCNSWLCLCGVPTAAGTPGTTSATAYCQ